MPLALLSALALTAPASAQSDVPASPGDVVGFLEVEIPESGSFLLHGTLPLPRGTWIKPKAVGPLLVLNHDGTPVGTQTEAVSRYASPQDGVDVAEVIARVHSGSATPGSLHKYRVVYYPHLVETPPAPSMDALLEGIFKPALNVRQLVSDPDALIVEAVDAFGNSYIASPFDGSGSLEVLRHGPMQNELKISQTLMPAPQVGGPQGTLPHHLSFSIYLTVTSQSEVVGLDMRMHNAHSGNDTSDVADDPLGTVYFDSINLYLRPEWAAVQDFTDPFLDIPKSAGQYFKYPLVKPNPGGKVHAMEWQSQFHRRLALAPIAQVEHAQEILRGEGLGFARKGQSPVGKKLWSWWNLETARWFPQSHVLPSLDHIGLSVVRSELKWDLGQVQPHLEQGTSKGDYPVQATVMGYAHPYGVPYGGMASGNEIFLVDGVRTVATSSRDGYQLYRILHRMHSDRMPSAFYNIDGNPTAVDDWVIDAAGDNDFLDFTHFMLPVLDDKPDPFGLSDAPTFHDDYVKANNLIAPYAEELWKYDPHDYQHLVRYTRSAKTLAWLANDSLAKDDLRMQAENFHLSYHSYKNGAWGYVQGSGLRHDQNEVEQYGPAGITFGRGEAWGMDAAIAAYATGNNDWRAENRAWMDEMAHLIADGQSSCSGFIQATVSEKFFDKKYRARQIIEQSITENALVGMVETVYRGDDPGRTKMLEDVLRASLYAMLSPMAWSPNEQSPWAHTAVGEKEVGSPIFCSVDQLPNVWHSSWTDAFQNWSSFAYGFELTGDIVFLQAAEYQMGFDLYSALLADGTDNLQNRAALLALAQQLAGTL
ncbi:MAG: hypothetical protein AAF682_28895 [Planctomycetota bacterium]